MEDDLITTKEVGDYRIKVKFIRKCAYGAITIRSDNDR